MPPVEGSAGNPVLLDIWQNIVNVNFGAGSATISWDVTGADGPLLGSSSYGDSGWGSSSGGWIGATVTASSGDFSGIFNAITVGETGYVTHDGWTISGPVTNLRSADLSWDWALGGSDPGTTYNATLTIALFMWDPNSDDADRGPIIVAEASGSLSGNGNVHGTPIASGTLTFSYSGPLPAQNPAGGLALWIGYQLSTNGGVGAGNGSGGGSSTLSLRW